MTKFFLHTAPKASFPCPPTPKRSPPAAPLADLKKVCSNAETKVLQRPISPVPNRLQINLNTLSSLTHPLLIPLSSPYKNFLL